MSETVEERIRRQIELAERSTKDISEADIRRVAFQTVLAHLLQNSTTVDGAPVEQGRLSRRVAKEETTRRAPTRRVLDGPSAWVAKLIEEGFFTKPRQIGDVVNRLGEVGHTVLSKDVSYPLAHFCDLRLLRRTRTGKDSRGRAVWSYTNY
jgi:hypothetical protein